MAVKSLSELWGWGKESPFQTDGRETDKGNFYEPYSDHLQTSYTNKEQTNKSSSEPRRRLALFQAFSSLVFLKKTIKIAS
jgi:hypothetical protein